MGDALTRHEQLSRELERLEESCLYLAQAQFETANRKGGTAKRWLMLIPGIVSAAVGTAVALGAPPVLAAITGLSGLITTIGGFLGIDRDAMNHEIAGKVLTTLRHEARFLREATSSDLSDAEYHAEVKRLSDRYNSYQTSQPSPAKDAFDTARASVKDGKFDFDSDLKRIGHEAAKALPSSDKPALPVGKGTGELGPGGKTEG